MKKKGKNNVTIWIICAVILVVLIAVIAVLIVNGTSANKTNAKNNEENTNTNTVIEEPVSKITEQEMIEKYGVSIKNAEEIVLANFNSDNYECETKISEDEYYMITVIDTFDKTKYKFKVDPVTKTAFLLED